MYEKKQNHNFIKRFLTGILLVILSSTFSIIIYDMYLKIDITNYSSNSTAIRLGDTTSTNQEKPEDITHTRRKHRKFKYNRSFRFRHRHTYIKQWIYSHKLACCREQIQ